MACPTPEMKKNTVIKKPSSENDRPNCTANTGNNGGSSRCAKCELACASPTRPMMRASWRSGVGAMGTVVAARVEAAGFMLAFSVRRA